MSGDFPSTQAKTLRVTLERGVPHTPPPVDGELRSALPSTAGPILLPAVLSLVQAAVASQLPPPWSPLLPSGSWISHLLLHDIAPQN